MLHPSRLRIDLAMLLLRAGHRPARGVKHNEARARRPLVNGCNVLWHLLSRSIADSLLFKAVSVVAYLSRIRHPDGREASARSRQRASRPEGSFVSSMVYRI